jgi:hypothetical protein
MIDFPEISPFGLVRRLGVAGPGSPAIYLLICAAETEETVCADIVAETDVQLGISHHIETATELRANGFELWNDGSVRVLRFDAWHPDVAAALDRSAGVLVQDGGQLLLLAPYEAAIQLLREAPNLRSRIIGVFRISPEDFSGAMAG